MMTACGLRASKKGPGMFLANSRSAGGETGVVGRQAIEYPCGIGGLADGFS